MSAIQILIDALLSDALAPVRSDIRELKEYAMATQAENQAKVDALSVTVGKVLTEVLDLKARYDAGQTLDFSAVEGLLGQADAVNEDLPAEEPAPEEPTA